MAAHIPGQRMSLWLTLEFLIRDGCRRLERRPIDRERNRKKLKPQQSGVGFTSCLSDLARLAVSLAAL